MRTSRIIRRNATPGVRHALRKLGRDIRDARWRRIPAAIAAQRASIVRSSSRSKRAIPASRSGYTLRSFLCWAWRSGWAISPHRRTIPWACNSKKKTCRSAFAWRAARNARTTSDGQRGSSIRGSRRRSAPDGRRLGHTRIR
jgi:hypothetical protein